MTSPGEPGIASAPPAYQRAGLPCTQAQFYAAACDPLRPVVVQACAGAGKTWMLVSRMLRALLTGTEPQQLLAITFTRKAAGEMRQRLEDWLAEFSACSHDERVHALLQRGLDEGQAQTLAPALGSLQSRLLCSGRSVEVRTFHGWFAQLLANAPLAVTRALGLPPAYEPLEDISVLHDALFRRFHRAVQRDVALRVDYLALVGRHRRATLLLWLENAWRRGPELARADAAGHAHNAVPPASHVFAECQGLDDPTDLLLQSPWATDLQKLARQLGAASKATPQKAAAGIVAALAAASGAERLEGLWSALFTKEDTPRKHLGDSPLLLQVVDTLPRLRQWVLQQQAHEDHAAMLRLARELLAEYAEIKRQRQLVDMADLERAAEVLLGDSEVAGWVQERLDQNVRQVLIDEFQDTSPLQWQVLHGWLSSYVGAGGGASGQQPPVVFIVGDPKQSIYRFRGAEPRVFEAAQDFLVQGLGGVVLECDHTRRNAPAVVQALNAVFDDAARLDHWGPFRAHTTASTQDGALWRLPGVLRPATAAVKVNNAGVWRDSLTQPRQEPEQRLRIEEAEQAAYAVRSLIVQHNLAPGEVMVLARQRAMLALVAQALARLDVPHVVAEALALHQSPEVLDVMAVLEVLVSPGHDLALARALRSPIFGAGDDDLLWLAQAAARSAQPWLATLLAVTEAVAPTLQRAHDLFAQWGSASKRLTPHELLDQVLHQGRVLQRMAAALPAARRANGLHALQALLAAALNHGGGRFSTVYGFVRDLRAGRVVAVGRAPPEAVQLLTVHGAKGLEARAVVVVDSDPERRQPERATLLVDWPVEMPAPRGVAFVRNEAQLAPSLQAAWALDQQARQREEINSLYVAMTRARQWLVFSRSEPRLRNDAVRPWWERVHGQAATWELAPESSAGAVADASVPKPGLNSNAGALWLPRLPALTWQAPVELIEAADSAIHPIAARLGQAVHRVLEWAGRPDAALPAAQWPAASAAAAASMGLDDDAAAAQVLGLARAVLTSADCAPFFSGPTLFWAGNEVSVVSPGSGQVRRIDRLVALQGAAGLQWWVLDYKLNSRPAQVQSYRDQLLDYVAAVQVLQPGQAVHGAFITGRGELLELSDARFGAN